MKIKKILAMILTAGIAVSSITGCGTSKSNFFTVAAEAANFEGRTVDAKIVMDKDLFKDMEGFEDGLTIAYKGKSADDAYDMEVDIDFGDISMVGRVVGGKDTVYIEKDIFEGAYKSIMGMILGTSGFTPDFPEIDATYVEIPLDNSTGVDLSVIKDMDLNKACESFGEFFAMYKSTMVTKDRDTYKFIINDDTLKADAEALYKAVKRNPKKMGKGLLSLADGLESVVSDKNKDAIDKFRETIENNELKDKDEDDFIELFNLEDTNIEVELTKKGKEYSYVANIKEVGGTEVGLTLECTLKESDSKVEMPSDSVSMDEFQEQLGGTSLSGGISVDDSKNPFLTNEEEVVPTETETLDFDKNENFDNIQSGKDTIGKNTGLGHLYTKWEFSSIADVIESIIDASDLNRHKWTEEYSSTNSDYVSKTYEAENGNIWYSMKVLLGNTYNDFDFSISWQDRENARACIEEYTQAIKKLSGIDLNDHADVISHLNKVLNGEAVDYTYSIDIDDDTDCSIYISDDADDFGTYMSFDFYHYLG